MTYSASSTAPLIYYPDIAGQLANYGFETAFAAADWTASGTSVPTRDLAVFKYGVASAKFNPAAQTSLLTETQTFILAPGWKSTGNLEPWYVYFIARVDAVTGTPAFTVVFDMRDSSHNVVATQTATGTYNLGAGGNIPTTAIWGLYRAGPLTPTTYTNVTEMKVVMGFAANSTATMYVDNVYLGHALDFQDIGISGACDIVHPYKYRKQVFCDYDENEYGAYSSRRYNTGFYTGEFETTGFPESARTSWQNFADYGMDGTAWTLWHDRTRVDRDYFAKVMTDQDHYGTEQIPGKLDWKAKMKWRQVIA